MSLEQSYERNRLHGDRRPHGGCSRYVPGSAKQGRPLATEHIGSLLSQASGTGVRLCRATTSAVAMSV